MIFKGMCIAVENTSYACYKPQGTVSFLAMTVIDSFLIKEIVHANSCRSMNRSIDSLSISRIPR